MAAVARGSASFALPATQNTAPVHEFRCLYTHDVRKKAKKWHDGSARFHTFNKRVMVYDDAKNFIGDLHYRADEEFGEGIELQLDRGVLVEVGERMGETQTDLTGIVHKPAAENNLHASSVNVRALPMQRVNHINSQGRPRSLTELLGTSQGRHGRAMLPLDSPFQQRQALRVVQHSEPPLKRQKHGPDKENDNPTHQPERQVHVTRQKVVPSKTSNLLSNTRLQERHNLNSRIGTRQAHENQRIVDISSDDDDVPRNGKSSIEEPRTSKKSNIGSTRRQSMDNTTPCSRSDRIDTQDSPVRHRGSLKASNRTANKSIRSETRPNVSTASRPCLRPGMSSLKMRSQEPRRKLMYKALLPSSVIDKNVTVQSIAADAPEDTLPTEGLHHTSIGTSEHCGQDDDLAISDFEDLDVAVSSPHSLNNTSRIPVREESLVPKPQSTSLFVSQTGSQRSPTPQRTFIEDDFSIALTQHSEADQVPVPIPIDTLSFSQADQDKAILEPESPCFPQPPSKMRSTIVRSLVPVLPPEPPHALLPDPHVQHTTIETPSPKKSRPFTRSLSENDSPLPNDPRTTPHKAILLPIEESPHRPHHRPMSPLIALPLPQPSKPRNPSPIKSSFQRSHSDTSAIIPTTIAPTQVVNSDEQGPWTSLEAFLLFDKWPMCKMKDKPIFDPLSASQEDEMDLDDEMISAASAMRVQPVMIRSARAVWRDG